MGGVFWAFLYALFVWWFSTGLVFLAVLRPRNMLPGLAGATVLFPVSLYVLARTSGDDSVLGAYIAFSAAILLWGTQELAFLSGFLTGPRPLPAPPGVRGFRRAAYAVGAIAYHEIGLAVSGIAILAVTWGQTNQVGTLTFVILWVMRLSAKLNLFLGVPVLNDEIMPGHLTFLRSYFVRGPVNRFFPIAMILSLLATSALLEKAFAVDASPFTQVGSMLLAALLALAVLEHGFMLVRLPIDALWRWSTRGHVQSLTPNGTGLGDTHRRDRHCDLADIKRVLPTET